MSFQFNSESYEINDEIENLDSINDSDSSTNETIESELENLESNHMSTGEQFVYEAEITNSYLEDGDLSLNDMQEAEQIAEIKGHLSDAAFKMEDTFDVDTHAGEIIEGSLLHEAYFENGYIDTGDMIEAEHQASMQEPWEQPIIQSTYDEGLSESGEFIQDSLLEQSYLDNGTFINEDVDDATHEAYENQEVIEDVMEEL